jgi:hypothetical protein
MKKAAKKSTKKAKPTVKAQTLKDLTPKKNPKGGAYDGTRAAGGGKYTKP